ncbi:hypothetical protein FPV67DRAFT_1463805 [Lyophyllum atratum]|nr:hypothetical protein FPV67DRAFT_1463805 [Lyophyllum atratum]
MHRCLQAVVCARRSYSTALPWFVDQAPVPHTFTARVQPPHLPHRATNTPPLPENTPSTLRELHAQLAQSPHLESSTATCRRVNGSTSGATYFHVECPKVDGEEEERTAGESAYDIPGGLWNWVVVAQVKEGTENKGAIESVVRVIRKTLLAVEPPLPLPPNSKRRTHNGWAMIDGGDFAVPY